MLVLLILATQSACGSVAWRDRYDAADVSHRTTAELCRSGGASDEEFDRCMEELLPPSWY